MSDISGKRALRGSRRGNHKRAGVKGQVPQQERDHGLNDGMTAAGRQQHGREGARAGKGLAFRAVLMLLSLEQIFQKEQYKDQIYLKIFVP